MSLDGAVVHVSLHPELALPSRCIASFAVGPPALVDFATDSVKPLPALVMGKTEADTQRPNYDNQNRNVVLSDCESLMHPTDAVTDRKGAEQCFIFQIKCV